ncbi:hypothetical protein [Saccharothrix lopnurensis]|uniref:DUF2637 domain-containing protein n=1 Tax=Saccharothrix lopnurensis TaxID=1670621 RepID=A0ABW1P591_9PSEU
MTTSELVSPALLQSWAREAYRKSLEAGQPLNRAELAKRFDRSESWARDRIAEVRREDGLAEDSGTDNAGDTPTGTLPPIVPEQPPAPAVEAAPPVVELAPVAVADTPDMTPPAGDMTPAGTPAQGHPGARFVAWFGFAFGSLVSIAANWLAAWLPAGDMPDGWTPSIASQVGAAVWPVALLVSVEVLSRTAWRGGWQWTAVRFGGVAAVALGSGVISYGHIHDVLLSWGYDPLGAGVGPLVIDGLMVVSGFALLAMSGTNTRKA